MNKYASAAVAAGVIAMTATAGLLPTGPIDAAPIRGAGHVDMAWRVTDASGGQPPDAFGGGRTNRWAGSDRVWTQPGFTGAYLIVLDGATVAAYCADFHNAKHPDAASTWVRDSGAFLGSDKALTKLSYVQWRWGSTTDSDTAAALKDPAAHAHPHARPRPAAVGGLSRALRRRLLHHALCPVCPPPARPR